MNAPAHPAVLTSDAKPLMRYKPYWAKRFGVAPFLPMSLAEMEALGWDSCDVILVTGDAYVDHPSFGMAVIGRVLQAQGFRVGIIAQPDWTSAEALKVLGRPNLFWGVTAGNMDSMINRYTADRKIRSDDAYTPGGGPASGPTVPASSMPSAAERRTRTCRSSWGDRSLVASRCALRLLERDGAPLDPCWTPRPTCCCMAMPSARWWRWRTGWRGASRSTTSPT